MWLGRANHTIGWLIGLCSICAVDPNLFNGPLGGAHAVQHAGPLKGRASRAGASHQPFAAPQHSLAVGAHIQEQGEFLGLIHAAGQHAGADIGANITGYPWQAVHGSFGMKAQAEVCGCQQGRMVDGGDKRRQADTGCRDAKQQVDHGAVAGNGGFNNLLWLDVRGAFACPLDKLVYGLNDPVLHFLPAAIFAGIDDARDHIFAARNLAIVLSYLGCNFASDQVNQPHRHCGGANINGNPPERLALGDVTRQEIDQPFLAALAIQLNVRIQQGCDVPDIHIIRHAGCLG